MYWTDIKSRSPYFYILRQVYITLRLHSNFKQQPLYMENKLRMAANIFSIKGCTVRFVTFVREEAQCC